jgi:hypothetical protein
MHARCSVCMKVEAGENAVLCTHNKTFMMQAVETSNSLMILPLVAAAAGASAEAPAGGAGEGAVAAQAPACVLRVEGLLGSHWEVGARGGTRVLLPWARTRPCSRTL